MKIKYTDDGEEMEEIREIIWSGAKKGYSPLNWEEFCENCDFSVEIKSVEIIGNIRENPELLEVSS